MWSWGPFRSLPRRSWPWSKPPPISCCHLLSPFCTECSSPSATTALLSPQKKSRNETYGEGSGVEILENRPYTDGPGGSGQYTHKVYHVGMHIPGWFRSILPKAALRVVEESWNAYPYTRTRCATSTVLCLVSGHRCRGPHQTQLLDPSENSVSTPDRCPGGPWDRAGTGRRGRTQLSL